MPFSTFTKVGSLYRTTLKQGIASNATALEFNDTPLANIEYPNWFVIEPNSSNYEIIYCPTAPTGAAFTGVVRGINPGADVDTTDVAYQKGHAANVEVVLAPLHRQWNQLVDVMDGNSGTGGVNLRIGKDADDDIKIIAQNADVNKPFLIYDKTLNKWLISNDGASTYDPSLGGSGLTAGLGTTLNASAIDLDLRANGGLRNNQGTGSKQADVDPTIVARLDTANTWAAVQSVTADNLQVTSDANSANDAVRKSYLDDTLATFSANFFGDGSDGNVTINAPTTLTRDMFYDTLTLDGSTTLNTGGYKIYAKTGIVRAAASTTKIRNNGGNGGNGSNSVTNTGGAGGTAGAAAAGITVPTSLAGVAGATGGGTSSSTGSQAGVNGTAGTAQSPSYCSTNGANGAAGGNATASGSANGGTGGTGGASTVTKNPPRSLVRADVLFEVSAGGTIAFPKPMGSSASGGTGAYSRNVTQNISAGGSGGSGGGGGVVWICAKTITDNGTGTMFEAIGGTGGNGGNPDASGAGAYAVGGSAGGNGGSGGVIIRIYKLLTGSGTTSVDGGTGGNGSTGIAGGGGSKTDGSTGTTGTTGQVFDIIV